MTSEDKTLDAPCAEAEGLLAEDPKFGFYAERLHVLKDWLFPRLLAERKRLIAAEKAWLEGRPMDEAPRDGTRIWAEMEIKRGDGSLFVFDLVNYDEDLESFDGYENVYQVNQLKRWWPLPGGRP